MPSKTAVPRWWRGRFFRVVAGALSPAFLLLVCPVAAFSFYHGDPANPDAPPFLFSSGDDATENSQLAQHQANDSAILEQRIQQQNNGTSLMNDQLDEIVAARPEFVPVLFQTGQLKAQFAPSDPRYQAITALEIQFLVTILVPRLTALAAFEATPAYRQLLPFIQAAERQELKNKQDREKQLLNAHQLQSASPFDNS